MPRITRGSVPVFTTLWLWPWAVVAQAGINRRLHAVVQAHTGTGQKIHDLAAVGVGMKADGGAGLQRQPQDLAHTVLKDAGLGLPLAALEPGLHQRGHTVKVQRHGRSLSSGSP